MSTEFTGERVIPGQVDIDLWNEHVSRYAFAARLARRKRVLDVGCGAGYGSAELANTATAVTGIDISAVAVEYAAEHYQRPNLSFQCAGAAQLPFADGSFDLVVAFEVIEHLSDWQKLIAEARRVLSPGGQFVVSTPNKAYYAESRKLSGPNPFHEHEFEYEEFKQALEEYFPHTLLFTENHADSIVFRPIADGGPPAADVRLDGEAGRVEEAHFFIAVCAGERMTGAPAFLYVPTAANVLRERERHIARLEGELATKDQWLAESQERHASLVQLHDEQTAELKRRNEWALTLNQRIAAVQDELVMEKANAAEAVEGYQAELARVAKEQAETIEWARKLEAELAGVRAELGQCVAALHQTEATVEERTKWAQSLDAEIAELRRQLEAIQGSAWHKIGRRIGFGPKGI
jgi:SAM-dependent methyltransferase